tara:strand:- start:14242 stop:15501 length:1260 start_codon:yes stop_codon:yes gene_type:complete
MASFNLTNFDAAMKQFYPQKKVDNLVYKNNPLLAWMPKVERFPGRNAQITVEYGMPGGRSANLGKAITNRSGTQLEDFIVTRVKDYAVVSVDNEAMLAADGNEGSLIELARNKTDSALRSLSRAMGIDVFRGGTGALGLSTDVSLGGSAGADYAVFSADDITNFEINQKLVYSLTDGSALQDSGAILTVSKVDYDNNRVYFTEDLVAGSTHANLDADKTQYFYADGDAANGGTNVKLAGLDAWIPSTVSATGFFGVDRTTHPTRLAGQRISGGTGAIKEALIDGMVRCAREGGMPDAAFMSPELWAELAKDIDPTGAASQVRVDHKSKDVSIGFTALKIAGPTGVVEIFADHNCQANTIWLLQKDTWQMRTIGSAPRVLDFDGLKGLRQAESDGVEYRWGYYGNVICTAPGWNCRITLT